MASECDHDERGRPTDRPGVLPNAKSPRRATAIQSHRICAHWTFNVFDVLLACIVELQIELALHVIVGSTGNQHPAGRAELLQSRSHINPIAEQVITVQNDIADIDPDPEN